MKFFTNMIATIRGMLGKELNLKRTEVTHLALEPTMPSITAGPTEVIIPLEDPPQEIIVTEDTVILPPPVRQFMTWRDRREKRKNRIARRAERRAMLGHSKHWGSKRGAVHA